LNCQFYEEKFVAAAFDEEFDVVVAGYGFAGAVAAIEASDAGANVLLIEKMPDPGGISICAGGGVRIARNADDAFSYLQATNAGTTPDDILRVFADALPSLGDYIRHLAKVSGAEPVVRDREANYRLPGGHTFQFIEIDEIPGFDPDKEYPHTRARNTGPNFFKVLDDNVRKRPVEVRLSTTASRLITNAEGAVTGLVIESNGVRKSVKARRGVVLACGGFEANPAMQRQYWQFSPVLNAVSTSNTGDGIRMAQAVGADLWHMWHFHGSYGFRHPDPRSPIGIRMKRLPDWTPGGEMRDVKMSWILLSKAGRRFMNEYAPYTQDTGHRPLDFFDPVTQSFPYIPAHMVIDEDGRKMYPLGNAVYNDRNVPRHEWSKDNLKEVELGILKKADSIADLAKLLGVGVDVVTSTLERWNAHCASGDTDEFGRPGITMMPIKNPPFYTGEVWPVVSNTQGGPIHDARQRVLNSFSEPIPRLFEAGELGSIWGHLYMSGGNLAECFITGRIAGREAAGAAPWDQAKANAPLKASTPLAN
jgi:succinate dehydrogenase/fumarate reductase flavoprotein subunit